MGENYDIERLIVAVEKRTCLWDSGNEEYHDRQKKDLAWEDVCNEILEEAWVLMNVEQKKKICADVKKKWNNLRDCYRRDVNKIKNTPTGSGAKKSKKYIYADLLTFLSAILEKRNHTGNYADEENNRSLEEQDTENNQNTSNTLDLGDSSAMKESTPRNRKKEKDVPTQILKLIKEKRNEQTVEYEDDDDKYLLSFRSELKAMTKSQKIDFKIGMLQLLRKITDPQYSRNAQSSCFLKPETHNSRMSYLLSPSPTSNFSNSYSPSPPATYDRRLVNTPSTTSNSLSINTMHTIGSVPLFLRPTLSRQQEIPNQSGMTYLPNTSTMNATGTIPLNVNSTLAQQQESPLYDTEEEYIDDDMSIYLKFKNQDSV